jgi:hypothetical protein
MKKYILYPLLVLIVGTVISALVFWYITKPSPDIRYTLSDSIPISFLNPEGNPEIIQQLEIKNVGNESAKNIQIKIKGEIIANKLDKHSNADDVKIYNQDKTFEVVYPELPPQGGFKLTLKSINNDINKSNLTVLYNLGLAQEAFTKNQPSSYLNIFLPFVLPFIFSLPYFIGMWSLFKQSSLKYEKSASLLEMEKPWYIKESTWNKAIEETLHYHIGRDYISDYDLKSLDSYHLLSIEKPKTIDEKNWKNLTDKAVTTFKELYKRKLYYLDKDNILEFLKQKKPEKLTDKDWNELIDDGNASYISKISSYLDNSEDYLTELKRTKPSIIKNELWDKHLAGLKSNYLQAKKTRDFYAKFY